MRLQTTFAFAEASSRFRQSIKDKFRKLVPTFNAAAEAAADGADKPWPNGMRVKQVKSAKGVWELAWSLKGP